MTSLVKLVSDPYERKARLYPALLVLSPVAAVVVAVFPSSISGLRSLATVTASCGGLFLFAQLARTSGKRLERALFAGWGGKPSVTIFRHRDQRLGAVTKARYHQRLATLVHGTHAPGPTEETRNPRAADEIYLAWSDFLRVNARSDPKGYPLVFQESINYGYCRNAWGMRPVGIISTACLTVLAGGWGAQRWIAHHAIEGWVLAAAAFCLAMLLVWVLVFTREWVRIPAEAYAERLAETVEHLNSASTEERSG